VTPRAGRCPFAARPKLP
jgi:hypothetical protein